MERLPQNDIQRVLYKLNQKHNFDNVAAMSIRDVNEKTFVENLHEIDVARMEKAVKNHQAKKKIVAEDERSSKAEEKSTTADGGTDKERSSKQKDETSREETVSIQFTSPSLTQINSNTTLA